MSKKSSATGHSPHLIVSKPISVLNRDIKLDSSGLFKALGKSIVHFGTGKIWELSSDVTEAAASLGLKTDPGGLAWYLIHRSLLRAMRTLTDEAWLRRTDQQQNAPNELAKDLDREIGKTTLELNKDFFRQPNELPFLDSCIGWFSLWLKGVGFDNPRSASISQRLRTYFVYALNQEWRSHIELYAPIITSKDTPFSQAGERERAWEQYRAWLDQELDGALFGEPFSLRQLYIPLRGYYQRVSKNVGDTLIARDPTREEKRIAVDLTSHLLNWVRQIDRDDVFRVISGGPGSGKSSMARMFTADVLSQTSWRALYIPLHRIQYKGEIIPAIEDYLRRTSLLAGNEHPLNLSSGDSKLLLIFDGLDELAMLGKLAQETASQFVRAVKDFVRDHNTTGLRIKVILTGRTVIMQSLESEFRKEGAVIHLCPYFVEKSEEKHYELGWKLLAGEDQRQRWWSTYGELTGRGYSGLPKHFDRQDLVEVSSEPLLNYLLALADQTETLDFSQHVTQNQIYASLVHELYDRRWADGENFAVKGMTEDHFHRVLEEIAVAAWHGDGRKTTVGEIKQHCQDAGIMKMLETFQEGAENGVLRLLTAFFFRQAGVRDDENAFEFTHKSFGEYLVARRIVRMTEIMERKAEEQKREFTGWDERKCLEEWARLNGASALTERQAEFLQNEMYSESARPASWQLLLIALANTILRQGLPMEKLGLPDFFSMNNQSRNAEEAFLITLNACARVTKKVINISWPEVTSAGAWIRKLQAQRDGPANLLTLSALSYFNFDGQCLDMADFYSANLEFSSLRGVRGQSICFWRANLTEACFEQALMSGGNFQEARMVRANLKGATLRDVSFQGADLRDADLRKADLRNSDFTGGRPVGSKHINPEMQIKTTGIKLEGANMGHEIQEVVILERANLKGAKLKGANLGDVNLKEIGVSEAQLGQSEAPDVSKVIRATRKKG